MSASGNISRVSSSIQTYTLLSQLQRNSLKLFREQQRLASGQNLLSVSDDPITAEKIARLNQSLDKQDQILANLQHAEDQLYATDNSINEISDLLIEAARIASEQAGSVQSAEERASQAVVIDGIIEQLVTIGNRQFRGLHLFAGREVESAPFSNTAFDRVTYQGDRGDRNTLIADAQTLSVNLIADELFKLREQVVGGYADFDVQLSTAARVSELNGALSAGVRKGPISVTDGGAGVTFTVDFTNAETVGGLIDAFNQAAADAGSTLTLGINPADAAALRISGGAGATAVSEVGSGHTAADLGLLKNVGAGVLDGDGVQRRVTLTTAISDLAPGGLALGSGVSLTHGDRTATVSFAGVTTVQDILNRLNASGVGIRASINEAGDGIEIESLVSGTPLVVGENGGTDAEVLGIKSIDRSTSLGRVNGQLGLHPIAGQNDLRVTDSNGIVFEVGLSNAQTIGDVIDRINAAAGAAGSTLTATTNLGGAGLRLVDGAGAGAIVVERVGMSPVAAELGIEKTGTSAALEGDNVAKFIQTGIFSALYRLRDGLMADRSVEISEAGAAINSLQKEVAEVQGVVGNRARSAGARRIQTEDAVTATRALLSGLADVDITEAVTRFQQAQTALQANLLVGSQSMNLSLMDFLA